MPSGVSMSTQQLQGHLDKAMNAMATVDAAPEKVDHGSIIAEMIYQKGMTDVKQELHRKISSY